MPPNVLPSPSDFSATPFAAMFFTFYAGVLGISVATIFALYVGWKKRNWLPLLLIGGGLLSSVMEPMADLLIHLRWANNLIFLFTAFGISIPLLIVLTYGAMVGLLPYFVYRLFKRGVTVKQIMVAYVLTMLINGVVEIPGVQLNILEYYGVQPYKVLSFPFSVAALNAGFLFVIAFMIWYLDPRLKGWHRAWFLLVPTVGLSTTYFSVGSLHMLALNSELPEGMKWAATTITIAGYVGLVRGIANFVATPTDTATEKAAAAATVD